MPIRPSLLQEIRAALGQAITPNLNSASATEDLYEAYVWSLALMAARQEGFGVTFSNAMGLPVTQFIFRTSPSAIYSLAQPYTFAILEFPGSPALEAHVGIYVAGRSQVRHECDVAVVHRSEAMTCRENGVHPRSSKVLLAAECKFYSTNLPIDLARSFLGLTEEILQTDRYFVSNTSSNSVVKMLTTHRRHWETWVSPLDLRMRDRLRGYFETTFKHFKALHG